MTAAHDIILIVLSLVFSAFFAASETAIFSLSPIERRRIQNRHRHIGKVVNYLLDHPRRTLIAVLIGNNLVNILATTIISSLSVRLLGDRGIGIAITVCTVAVIVFGEIIPKTLAIRNDEAVSAVAAYPLHYFAVLIAPVRRLVRWITDVILSLLIHEKVTETDTISEKELQALVQIGQEEGVLDKDEGDRLERLFALEERSVNEIMTPRTELIAFDIQENRQALIELLQKYHYTYMPVFQDSLDNIVGMISTQEVMLNEDKDIRALLKPPYYIPETKRIDDLLFEMKKSRVFFAICVDEYGGTAGLVTQEDILEEIFGEIYDEYAKKEISIVKFAKDEYLVDGKMPLDKFSELLGLEISSEVSETVGGWILEHLGRIPRLKETFKLHNLHFEVRELDRQRIAKVFVRKGGGA